MSKEHYAGIDPGDIIGENGFHRNQREREFTDFARRAGVVKSVYPSGRIDIEDDNGRTRLLMPFGKHNNVLMWKSKTEKRYSLGANYTSFYSYRIYTEADAKRAAESAAKHEQRQEMYRKALLARIETERDTYDRLIELAETYDMRLVMGGFSRLELSKKKNEHDTLERLIRDPSDVRMLRDEDMTINVGLFMDMVLGGLE